jgi:alpha-beta hydrolase superfamily lysophospholipase
VREAVAFHSDGVVLRGWFERPEGDEPVATVVATHGLASVIDFLEPLASELVAAGFGVLAFDHRSLGRSDGEPRQEVDPWRQVQDMRNAISFLSTRSDVAHDRIGVWGASMGGGVAVTTAALDERVRAVVGVVLVASGWNASQLMTPAAERPALQAALDDDRLARISGRAAATVTLVPEVSDEEVAQSSDESLRFLHPRAKASPSFQRYMTLRSLENIRDFEPLAHAHRISPRAIMLIVASEDDRAPVSDAQRLIDSIEGGHKVFKVIDGGHYVPLDTEFAQTAQASIDFFRESLLDESAKGGSAEPVGHVTHGG